MFGFTLSFNTDGGRAGSGAVFRTKKDAQAFAKVARKYQSPSKRIRVVKATKKEYQSWVKQHDSFLRWNK